MRFVTAIWLSVTAFATHNALADPTDNSLEIYVVQMLQGSPQSVAGAAVYLRQPRFQFEITSRECHLPMGMASRLNALSGLDRESPGPFQSRCIFATSRCGPPLHCASRRHLPCALRLLVYGDCHTPEIKSDHFLLLRLHVTGDLGPLRVLQQGELKPDSLNYIRLFNALARLNRARRDQLFASLDADWLDGKADGFLSEVEELGERMVAVAEPNQ